MISGESLGAPSRLYECVLPGLDSCALLGKRVIFCTKSFILSPLPLEPAGPTADRKRSRMSFMSAEILLAACVAVSWSPISLSAALYMALMGYRRNKALVVSSGRGRRPD